ncbi:competence type IV pilus ATPase ComGA [Liquorilactobacillus oeni]|uniref:competence type IV pilus ATPase ComGA n=1 Tax=Liquorilactobacillus oeni TaxID=303241 RepID=UPI0007109445|nr:competence type IV pilus ATPase ComGA [Liquorilactobacillus oeni]
MVTKSLNELLKIAIEKEASDIFFMPKENCYLIKLNIAGELKFLKKIEKISGVQMINNLKYRANMMLSEHRRPQTGAMEIAEQIYGRLSSVGDFLGRESLVIRLIYQKKTEGMFFFQEQFENVVNNLQKKGLILFSGPVGSGKTTTMYHVARQLKKQVMCIEDPVEINEPSFLQLQVNEKAQMTYAELIKSALRHRPDVFIIGEIRDKETATSVINAALSGHLVISTVHAANVNGVIRRMLALGAHFEDLNQTLNLICYQRLLPTVQGESKVLFDQLFFDTPDTLDFIKNNGSNKMTMNWRMRLEKCLENQWITQQTFVKYLEG